MGGRTFVDTNILIYAHDIDAEQKHEIAKEVLQDLWANRSGFLSPQVLQEFYVNVTRKRSKLLVKTSARAVVDKYAIWCVDTTSAEIAVAFRIEDEARIGFWDALIYASALRAGAEQIISEDLNAGQKIAGIRVVNPFARLKLK
jgi:predicted nucleic acid-binding protein